MLRRCLRWPVSRLLSSRVVPRRSTAVERIHSCQKALTRGSSLARVLQEMMAIYSGYSNSQYSIWDDLWHHTPHSEQLSRFLQTNFESSTLRRWLLCDLALLYHAGDWRTVALAMELMRQWRVLPQVMTGGALDGCEAVRNALIELLALNGELLVSASLILDASTAPDRLTLAVMRGLAQPNYEDCLAQYFTVIRLLQHSRGLTLSTTDATQLLEFYLADPAGYPAFANRLVDIYEQRGIPVIPRLGYDLLAANLEYGNVYEAFCIYQTHIKPRLHELRVDLAVLLKLLDSMSQQAHHHHREKVSAMLADLQPFWHEPQLEGIVLRILAQRQQTQQFLHFVRGVKPLPPRATLELLLEVFVAEGNRDGAEKILATLFKSKRTQVTRKSGFATCGPEDGLTAREFDIVVSQLLADGQFEAALTMIRGQPVFVSKYAQVTLLKHALQRTNLDIVRVAVALLTPTIGRLRTTQQDGDVVARLTQVVMQFMVDNVDPRAARRLYVQLSRERATHELMQEFVLEHATTRGAQLEPTIYPCLLQLGPHLHMAATERLPLLLTIFGGATADAYLCQWCVAEMVAVGLTTPEALDLIRFVHPELYAKCFVR